MKDIMTESFFYHSSTNNKMLTFITLSRQVMYSPSVCQQNYTKTTVLIFKGVQSLTEVRKNFNFGGKSVSAQQKTTFLHISGGRGLHSQSAHLSTRFYFFLQKTSCSRPELRTEADGGQNTCQGNRNCKTPS